MIGRDKLIQKNKLQKNWILSSVLMCIVLVNNKMSCEGRQFHMSSIHYLWGTHVWVWSSFSSPSSSSSSSHHICNALFGIGSLNTINVLFHLVSYDHQEEDGLNNWKNRWFSNSRNITRFYKLLFSIFFFFLRLS